MNRFFIWAHTKFTEMIDDESDVDTNRLFQMMLDLTNSNITEKQFCDAYEGGKQIYKEFYDGMAKNNLPFSKIDVKNQIRQIQNYFAQQGPNILEEFDSYPDGEYIEEEEEEEEEENVEPIDKLEKGNNKEESKNKILNEVEKLTSEYFGQDFNRFDDNSNDYFEEEEEEEEEEEKFNEIQNLASQEKPFKKFVFGNEDLKDEEEIEEEEEEIEEEEEEEEYEDPSEIMMKENLNVLRPSEELNSNDITEKFEEEAEYFEEEDLQEEEEEEEDAGKEAENNDFVEIEFFDKNNNGEHDIDIIVPQYIKKMCQKYIPLQKIDIQEEKETTPPPESIELEFFEKDNNGKHDVSIIVPPQVKKMSQFPLPPQKIEIELSFDLETKADTKHYLDHEEDGKLHLYTLNVGFGNLIILSIGTKAIILDAGSIELTTEMENNNSTIPNPFVIPAATILKTKKVEYAIITHPTKDHFNLLKAILENSGHDLRDIQFICGGYEEQYEAFPFDNKQFSLDLNDLDNETILCKKEEFETMLNNFFISEKVYFNFLLPINFKEDPSKCENNDYSNLLLTIDYKGKRILIPGDSTSKTIKSLSYSDSRYLRNVDVFIVPNHGLYKQTPDFPLTIKSKLALISSDPKFYKCSLYGCPHSKYISELVKEFNTKAPKHSLHVWENQTNGSQSNSTPTELKTEAPIFSVSNNYFKYNKFCFNGIHLSLFEENEIEFEYRKLKLENKELEKIQLK